MKTSATDLNTLLTDLGRVGHDLAAMGAAEGSAGNLSIYLSHFEPPEEWRGQIEQIALPCHVPELQGGVFLVTGSGTRLRDLEAAPADNLGLVIVEPGGENGVLYKSSGCTFTRLTSEFNSHLAVHADVIARRKIDFHAIIHAQPVHLTYLSHHPAYNDEIFLNQRLLRWQPETILQFPDGIGLIPFAIPGSPEMMQGNVEAMRRHRLVVWARHGMMVRSDAGIRKAYDLIEYIEAAARYEYMNLAAGEPAQGLSDGELRSICALWGVEQDIF